MDNKTISWVSYLTIIGWIIALVKYNESEKASLTRFHLRQSFGIMATYFVLYIILHQVLYFVPFFLYKLFWLGDVFVLVLWIIGLVAAVNEEEKPVPVLGEYFQKWFTFVK